MSTPTTSDRIAAGFLSTLCPPIGLYCQWKNVKKDVNHIKQKNPDLYEDLKSTPFSGKKKSEVGKTADVILSVLNPAYGLIRTANGGGLASLFD